MGTARLVARAKEIGAGLARRYVESCENFGFEARLASAQPNLDRQCLDRAQIALYAFAGYWGAISAGVDQVQAREIANETILGLKGRRVAAGADWKSENESIGGLFNLLGLNLHGGDGEGSEIYFGHLFLAEVLGAKHPLASDMQECLLIYTWLCDAAGKVRVWIEGFDDA